MMENKPNGPTGYDEYLKEKFKALEDRLAALENKGNTDAIGSSGSTLEMMLRIHHSILNDPHTSEELQTVYLGQIVLMLGAIDDDLKALRQTLSNITGNIKESNNKQDTKFITCPKCKYQFPFSKKDAFITFGPKEFSHQVICPQCLSTFNIGGEDD